MGENDYIYPINRWNIILALQHPRYFNRIPILVSNFHNQPSPQWDNPLLFDETTRQRLLQITSYAPAETQKRDTVHTTL